MVGPHSGWRPNFSPAEIIEILGPHLTDERRARLDQVASKRSLDVVPVLENIYDRGNVSAAMRSAEAFGFLRMYLVERPGAKFKVSNRVTRGADKWLDLKTYAEPLGAVADLRAKGYTIWATDLATERSIDDIDWSRPTAIVLGNEKEGTSPEMRGAVDGCFRLPMDGFSQSFNISVAAALIFYRAHLERRRLGGAAHLNKNEFGQLKANYYLRTLDDAEAILRRRLRPAIV